MTFDQCEDFRNHFKNIRRVTQNSTRYYDVGDQIAYPSVTSIISFINADKFTQWRIDVGEEEANRIFKHSTTRGTRLHKLFEEYLQNNEYKHLEEYKVPLIQLMFNYAKSHLDERLDNIYQLETQMFSHKLCMAGTVDLICEVDGELSIVDFKTSAKSKPEDWLEDYFVQLSAYWAMFAENTGKVAKKLVVFLVGENGDVQIVERRNIMDYLKTLRDYANQFAEHHNA